MSFYNNLPTQLNSETLTPTIFEIVSSQEIDSLLPNSLRFILNKYIVSAYPNKFNIRLSVWFDEWFAILQGVVEFIQLTKSNNTFVDDFYSLQYINTGLNKSGNIATILKQSQNNLLNNFGINDYTPSGFKLTNLQVTVLILQKVIIPYLKLKLDSIWKKIHNAVDFNTSDKWKILFNEWYPKLTKFLSTLNILAKLNYLNGSSHSTTVLEKLFHIEYARLQPTPSTGKSNSANNILNRPTHLNNAKLFDYLGRVSNSVNNSIFWSIKNFLPAFIFFIKVYQWWNQENITQRLLNNNNSNPATGTSSLSPDDIIAPPTQTRKYSMTNNHTMEDDKSLVGGKCPICKDSITNPCILETGCIGCYPCLINYIKDNDGLCPITNTKLLGFKFNEQTKQFELTNGLRRLLI